MNNNNVIPLDGETVLIIEDENILGEILLSKITSEGYNAFWEKDGEAGLAKMRKVKPDIVLLDIVMPKMNGYEVLETMNKDEELKKIPVIVISNSGQTMEIDRILQLGAKDYIVKAQFSPEEVLEKMRRFLKNKSIVQEETKKSLNGVKILIVEDDSFLSSIAVTRLSKEGYSVSLASDGEQALKFFESTIPDVVLMDILMPGINGLEVLKKMKADPRTKDISVIIFSNLGQDNEIEDGKKLGADDYFIKAKVTLKEVAERINTLLKKKGRI